MSAAAMPATLYPIAQPSVSPFAGFWRRFAACLIDWAVVTAGIFGLFVVFAFAAPKTANLVDVVGRGLPSTERILSEVKPDDPKALRQAIVETTVLDRLVYVHKVTVYSVQQHGATKTTTRLETRRVRLDPATHAKYTANWTLASLYFVPWLLYMVLMEASAAGATIGKMALGFRVTDPSGARIGILRALVRNLMKFVSAALMFVGYMMAGWTQRKQALHDMAAGCIMLKTR